MKTAQLFSFELSPKRSRRRNRHAMRRFFQQFLRKLAGWMRAQRRPQHRLRLCESVPLGEKRFVAVLEYDGQRYLIGGAQQSVQLLTKVSGGKFSKTLATGKAPLEHSQS